MSTWRQASLDEIHIRPNQTKLEKTLRRHSICIECWQLSSVNMLVCECCASRTKLVTRLFPEWQTLSSSLCCWDNLTTSLILVWSLYNLKRFIYYWTMCLEKNKLVAGWFQTLRYIPTWGLNPPVKAETWWNYWGATSDPQLQPTRWALDALGDESLDQTWVASNSFNLGHRNIMKFQGMDDTWLHQWYVLFLVIHGLYMVIHGYTWVMPWDQKWPFLDQRAGAGWQGSTSSWWSSLQLFASRLSGRFQEIL